VSRRGATAPRWGAAAGRASLALATRSMAQAKRPCALSRHIRHHASTSLGESRVCAQAGEDALADDGPPAAKLPKPGYYHIPSPVVVACMSTHRKPTDVRRWRGSSQSCVGIVPPVTSTPHWPACWARRSTSLRPWTWPAGCCQWRRRWHRWIHDTVGQGHVPVSCYRSPHRVALGRDHQREALRRRSPQRSCFRYALSCCRPSCLDQCDSGSKAQAWCSLALFQQEASAWYGEWQSAHL